VVAVVPEVVIARLVRRRARVVLRWRARVVLLRLARVLLRLLAVVVMMMLLLLVRVTMIEVEVGEDTKGFSLRQQFAELGVQFQQAKLRH